MQLDRHHLTGKTKTERRPKAHVARVTRLRHRKAPRRQEHEAPRIVQTAGLDVGSVEVVIDDRDGTPRFYDINALSNFVADPLNVLGWDPHEKLVEFLQQAMKGRVAA